MSGPRYANLARKALLRSEDATPPPAPEARERAASIAAIEQAIAKAGRQRRLARWGSGGVAAAAVVACALGGAHWVGRRAPVGPTAATATAVQIVAHSATGGASVTVSGAEGPLVEGRAVTSGSRIVTPPNGQASLSFSTGTTVALGPGADLGVDEQGTAQVLRLAAGSVNLHVAKLAAGARFLVDTADSEVEVRGTRFHVEYAAANPACGAGAVTRVSVSEGVVVVRHAGTESRVAAGEAWPRGCAASGGTATASATGAGVASAGRPARSARLAASDSASQNDSYAQGTRAWHRGDGQGALASFDQLLARYPGGPLAESASVERMRVLRSVAPERAAASARDYLARYPAGFARADAEALLAGPP